MKKNTILLSSCLITILLPVSMLSAMQRPKRASATVADVLIMMAQEDEQKVVVHTHCQNNVPSKKRKVRPLQKKNSLM